MVKNKIIKAKVESTRKVLNKFAVALGKAIRNKKVKHHAEITFESIEGLREYNGKF